MSGGCGSEVGGYIELQFEATLPEDSLSSVQIIREAMQKDPTHAYQVTVALSPNVCSEFPGFNLYWALFQTIDYERNMLDYLGRTRAERGLSHKFVLSLIKGPA